MEGKSLDFMKSFYYDVIQWQISNYIYHVKRKSYPSKYWNKSLKESLIKRNEIVQNIIIKKNNQHGQQLNLFNH